MRCLLLATAFLAAAPAQAQIISGPAVAIDGDTLDMAGVPVGLFGIDAPEAHQACNRAGEVWACGTDAAALLSELVAGEQLTCEQRGTEGSGRILATCKAGRLDLAAAIAEAGFALAVAPGSEAYGAAAATAQRQGLGIWAGQFENPAAFRAANPASYRIARTLEPEVIAVPGRVQMASRGAFRNCAAARAAGAAPVRRGQPGYGPHLDGDGDGIGCEPYRGR
jgi:endonuclease YncB( thermonuclease family)